MPTTKQRRQNARRRLQRQLDRRREVARRRRQRNVIIASVCAGILLLGGAGLAINQFVLDEDDNSASATPNPSETPDENRPELVSRTPEPIEQREPKVSEGPCQYTETEQTLSNPNAFDVGLPPDPDPTPNTGTVPVTFKTNQGDVTLELNRAVAPCTVQSFLFLAEQGFYDNTACPRSVNSGIFVVQCGDPTATTSGGPTYQYKDEGLDQASYTAGTVAMANGGPNTNGSQFFMIFDDSSGGLQPNYTPFATITEGLDIVAEIGSGGDDGSNPAGGGRPNTDFIIEEVVVPQ